MVLASQGSSSGLQALIARVGRLSGDGQLRELIKERHAHSSPSDAGIWYLPEAWSEAVFGVAGREAVVVQDPSVATWLELRFGVTPQPLSLEPEWLNRNASGLPPAAAPVALD
ncbi:hypothetical protein [Synechococcus sp. HK01-R]|uniref:hypothetical protein n=1 Tax=Synechococcus sp. HK01-R TaxID=2751171 RepID=UPI001624D808|nr:hypothetical protein [Synechococcus sp. HK01-R]QNG26446.1 hypothetical protein H0O21_09240 [Synechococcus sp. HK01-R]